VVISCQSLGITNRSVFKSKESEKGQDETDSLSRNVGKVLPLLAA
jgi:hypothetical protein